jgi:hypothetical protein
MKKRKPEPIEKEVDSELELPESDRVERHVVETEVDEVEEDEERAKEESIVFAKGEDDEKEKEN